jgi:hypothetical protein
MVASVAAAPPNFSTMSISPPVPFADPAPMSAQAAMPDPPAVEASEPLKGPVPLPRHKPHVAVAMITGTVPLPRPRPVTDEATPVDQPAYDRHIAE